MHFFLRKLLVVSFLTTSISNVFGGESLGVIPCKDAPVRVEIIDTLPSAIRWNHPYRVTHYIRNVSKKQITLYFLSRRVEYKWENTGGSTEESIAPQNAQPGNGASTNLYAGHSFVSSAEGSFGDRGVDGKVDEKTDFRFAFDNMIIHRVPRPIKIRFVYSFSLDPSGSTDTQHTIATGWKTLHIQTPKVASQ